MNKHHCRTGGLFLLGLLAGMPAVRAADNDIPGILQYAMKHTESEEGEKTATPAETSGSGLSLTAEALKRKLQQQTLEMNQLRRENRQLREQNKKNVAASDNTAEMTALTQRAEKAEQVAGVLKTSVRDLTAQLAQMPVVAPEALNDEVRRQDYAMGVMAGRDLLASRLPGLQMDNRTMLAGIRDALDQKVLLSNDALQTALTGAQTQAQQVVKNTVSAQKTAGDAYVMSFRHQNKDVHQDKSGFWYQLNYAGDGPLISGDETSVEIVVSEKLTDGTVVEDMDVSGRSLTMALGDFPPLFRSALVLMKNHGMMTLVAPPALAYGDAGYPPKVPPGATMVYQIRVDSVTPAPEMVLPDVKAIKAQQAADRPVAESGKPAGSKPK